MSIPLCLQHSSVDKFTFICRRCGYTPKHGIPVLYRFERIHDLTNLENTEEELETSVTDIIKELASLPVTKEALHHMLSWDYNGALVCPRMWAQKRNCFWLLEQFVDKLGFKPTNITGEGIWMQFYRASVTESAWLSSPFLKKLLEWHIPFNYLLYFHNPPQSVNAYFSSNHQEWFLYWMSAHGACPHDHDQFALFDPQLMSEVEIEREKEWRSSLNEGELCHVIDCRKVWLWALVIARRKNQIFIHYLGWQKQWDEWLDVFSPRLLPPQSQPLRYVRDPSSLRPRSSPYLRAKNDERHTAVKVMDQGHAVYLRRKARWAKIVQEETGLILPLIMLTLEYHSHLIYCEESFSPWSPN